MLGIHISPNALKLVEVEEQPQGHQVLNWSINCFHEDLIGESHSKALAAALKKNNIRGHEVNVALSSPELIYKLIDLPVLPENEVHEALKFKLEAALPQPIEDPIIDYYKIDGLQQEGKQFYFVAALPQACASVVLRAVNKAGLSVKALMPSSAALRNACQLSGPEPAALIYFGRCFTVIVLVKGGEVVFAREAAVGGENLTQALVGTLDRDQAEDFKDKFGIPLDPAAYEQEAKVPAVKIMEVMRPVLEKISSEILSTFEYYAKETGDPTEFKDIYLTGGASKTRNMLEYLNREAGLKVMPLPANFSSAEPDFADKAPFLSMALGAVNRGKKDLDLLPAGDQMAFRRPDRLILIAAAYVVVLALLFVFFSVKRIGLNGQRDILKKQLAQYGVTIGKNLPVQQGVLARLTKEFGVTGDTDRFVKVLGKLHRITPKPIYFERLTYDNAASQLTIKGYVLKQEGKKIISEYVGSLDNDPAFKSIDLSNLQESDRFTQPTFEFEIKCSL